MKINLKGKNILVVEDNLTMRMAIKAILTPLVDRNIVDVKNAEMALAALRQTSFDIVLCDYHLGDGQNGQQLLEEVKFCKLLPHTAIFIMVTSDNTHNMVLGAMEYKPDDYLLKPFNAIQLLNRLKKQMLHKQYIVDIEMALDADNMPLAIQHCEQLLQRNNHSIQTQLLKMRAEMAIRVGDLVTAEQKFRDILDQRELAWARHGLGMVALLQNHYDAAIAIFRQVIDEAPIFLESYDGLARAYEASQQLQEALNILKKATEISPNNILRQQKMAALALKTGNIEVAKNAYKAAVDLGKFSVHKTPYDYFKLVKIHQGSNDKQQVNRLLVDMRNQYRHDAEAQLRIAVLEAEIYQGEKNSTMVTKAYAKLEKMQSVIHHYCNDLQLNVAKTLAQAGNSKIANRIMHQLILNNVDDEKFIETIRHSKQFEQQTDELEKLITTTKQEIVDTNNKAVTLFKQGKAKDAIGILMMALQKMPDNKTILLNLITILIVDMKTHGITRDKLTKTENYIHKAIVLNVSEMKINQIQLEFSRLAYANYVGF